MSSSSRTTGADNSKVDLPVFVLPNEVVFSPSKRRTLITVYNPYGNEAQFRIMTTSPDRFDVSSTKGTIKPNRRIDITIRLLSQSVDELPDPTEQPQIVDYFKISTQVGSHKGNKAILVYWSMTASEYFDGDEIQPHSIDEKSIPPTSKVKLRTHKQAIGTAGDGAQQTSSSQRSYSNQRLATSNSGRPRNQIDHLHGPGGSNVNLVCFLCALACVIFLYLPVAIDSEFCKKAKIISNHSEQTVSLITQMSDLLSVSYEMKLGCSFALGLFTYRLISTLPN